MRQEHAWMMGSLALALNPLSFITKDFSSLETVVIYMNSFWHDKSKPLFTSLPPTIRHLALELVRHNGALQNCLYHDYRALFPSLLSLRLAISGPVSSETDDMWTRTLPKSVTILELPNGLKHPKSVLHYLFTPTSSVDPQHQPIEISSTSTGLKSTKMSCTTQWSYPLPTSRLSVLDFGTHILLDLVYLYHLISQLLAFMKTTPVGCHPTVFLLDLLLRQANRPIKCLQHLH
jgi:hypothetical protein